MKINLDRLKEKYSSEYITKKINETNNNMKKNIKSL